MSKMPKTKIRCAVSGIVTGCRPDVYDKRVEKYGDEETLHKSYVCSAAKRMLKEGKTIQEIRDEQNLSAVVLAELPTVEQLDSIVKDIVSKKTKSTTPRVKKNKIEETVTTNDDLDPDVAAFLNEGQKELAII